MPAHPGGPDQPWHQRGYPCYHAHPSVWRPAFVLRSLRPTRSEGVRITITDDHIIMIPWNVSMYRAIITSTPTLRWPTSSTVKASGICHTWCQDLAAAYRQFPVRNPAHGYTVLLTPAGPTLWRHNSLCFGATGSVWSFNRAADAMGFLARQLLATPVCHFVDDFSCTEPAVTSQSSYP